VHRLEGKVAIVTGGGRGIGRATAQRLAAEGAQVVVNDVDAEPARETVRLIADAGGAAAVSTSDAVDLDQAREMVAATVEAFGKLDILVNNAGTTRDKTFHNLDDSLWDTVIDVNLKTAFHACLAAMPHMREVAKSEIAERGAPEYHRKITLTSSSVALSGNPGQANYAAAKGAIISLTKTLARELGPFHINVNAVAPGFIETRLTAPKSAATGLGIPEQMRERARDMIALQHFGQPEDIAAAHAYLVSPDADFVSGVTLPVTGGTIGAM
jgi:3-oxoacyl-[acyl-carrier protein] reductase